MKVEVTKRQIEYTLVLDEEEADLLACILANQTGGIKNTVLQGMYNALAEEGAHRGKWKKDKDHFSNLYTRDLD